MLLAVGALPPPLGARPPGPLPMARERWQPVRINVYSEELTIDADRVTKAGTDDQGNPALFHAVRLYLHSSPRLHHTPDDDDRPAITIWLPRSLSRRVELAVTLRALAAWAEDSWPGGWEGVHDRPLPDSIGQLMDTT
jgi:hypothetical protein